MFCPFLVLGLSDVGETCIRIATKNVIHEFYWIVWQQLL
jgi:hypothetical protein